MSPLVIVFAKKPVPGRVKTRLIPGLGPELAASLHEALALDLLSGLKPFRVELHTDETGWSPSDCPVRIQAEGDLGDRMWHALESGLKSGASPVCIVGSDIAGLQPEYLEEILTANTDVTLGPTEDGGYYAISCRRVEPAMFDGVRWSSRRTREQTVEAVCRSGLSVSMGRPWFDVDELDDLKRLLRGPMAENLTRWTAVCPPGILSRVLS